jgi:hypothetical protein
MEGRSCEALSSRAARPAHKAERRKPGQDRRQTGGRPVGSGTALTDEVAMSNT